jgi:sugar fermentation stimulation protein A
VLDFASPLVEGKLLKRYKRFFADVELNGEVVVAHVPNTGSMKSCNEPGSPCLLSRSNDPKRTLKFTLEAVKSEGAWVGVNTGWPNKLAVEVFKQRRVSHWFAYDSYKAEVKINEHSRIDLLLWDSSKIAIKKWKAADFSKGQLAHLVEIKNVTLKAGSAAQFPDAVTERGQKHIQELCELIEMGFTAEMLFIVQRTDVEIFEPAKTIDPEYSRLLKQASERGLKITVLSFAIDKNGFSLKKELPLCFI